jgi:hypothetical protein
MAVEWLILAAQQAPLMEQFGGYVQLGLSCNASYSEFTDTFSKRHKSYIFTGPQAIPHLPLKTPLPRYRKRQQ